MKRWTRAALCAMTLVMCLMTLALPALAAVKETEVDIPVTVALTGTKPKPEEEYTIELKSMDATQPMPTNSTMTITGAKTDSFKITFNTVGIYKYTITQTPGTNKNCTYDKTVYQVEVYITNNEDMTGLESTVVVYKQTDKKDNTGDGQDGAKYEKAKEILFTNKYKVQSSGTPKTGDESSPMLYGVLIALGLGILLALFFTRRPRTLEE